MRLAALLLTATALVAGDPTRYDYEILATNKTSTMEKEMNEAAAKGYRFSQVMGGQTAAGGQEAVVAMVKDLDGDVVTSRRYKLLATQKTSTMQKELAEAGKEGFVYRGQTVYESAYGGQEVVVILEVDTAAPVQRIEYKLLATNKTSTMEKELVQAGAQGFRLVGLTVGKTAFGGEEVVSILLRETEE